MYIYNKQIKNRSYIIEEYFFSISQRMKRKKTERNRTLLYGGGDDDGGSSTCASSGGSGGRHIGKREPSPLDLVIDPSGVMGRALRKPNGITLNWTLSLKLR